MNSSANTSLTELVSQAAESVYGDRNHMALITLNSTFGVIPLNLSIVDIYLINASMGQFFAEDNVVGPQLCVFAISGQYGFLNRILYYFLLCFSLVVRKSLWLSGAALGVAMTYSSCAAVHAFALLARWPEQDIDVDMSPIFSILSAGAIMVTPILIWSDILRSEAARTFRPVVVLWGILIVGALIPSLIYTFLGLRPFVDHGGLSLCQTQRSQGCNLDALQYVSNRFLFIPQDKYRECQCMDTCGIASVDNVIFRKNSNLQALHVHYDSLQALVRTTTGIVIYLFNFSFVTFIALQYIPALAEYQWSPQHVRNRLFLSLAGLSRRDRRILTGSRKGIRSRYRSNVSKFIAGSGYLTSTLVFIISPFAFVSSIVINELQIWGWPSENYDAVGQWAPLAATACAIIAAAVQAYIEKYGLPWFPPARTSQDDAVLVSLSHHKEKIPHSLHRLQTIWPEFKAWMRDPVTVSRRELDFEKSPFHTEYGHCRNLVDLSTEWCVECKRGYCTACYAQGKTQGADLLVYGQLPDLEHQYGRTEDQRRSSTPKPSSNSVLSSEPYSQLPQFSSPSYTRTSPASLHHASPNNTHSYLGRPGSGAGTCQTFPRNATDDTARLYRLPTISLSSERLLATHLSVAPSSISDISQQTREPTPSPPSTPRMTTLPSA